VSVSAEKNNVGTLALIAYINANIDLPALGAAATIHTCPRRNLICLFAKALHTSGSGVALVRTPLQALDKSSNFISPNYYVSIFSYYFNSN
jgi:hypothetical protein